MVRSGQPHGKVFERWEQHPFGDPTPPGADYLLVAIRMVNAIYPTRGIALGHFLLCLRLRMFFVAVFYVNGKKEANGGQQEHPGQVGSPFLEEYIGCKQGSNGFEPVHDRTQFFTGVLFYQQIEKVDQYNKAEQEDNASYNRVVTDLIGSLEGQRHTDQEVFNGVQDLFPSCHMGKLGSSC